MGTRWGGILPEPKVLSVESFALERQLEVFLLENWERTPLAKEWAILSTPEEPEAGNQYPTDVGRRLRCTRR